MNIKLITCLPGTEPNLDDRGAGRIARPYADFDGADYDRLALQGFHDLLGIDQGKRTLADADIAPEPQDSRLALSTLELLDGPLRASAMNRSSLGSCPAAGC